MQIGTHTDAFRNTAYPHLPFARRVEWIRPTVGSPDLRIAAFLRLPMRLGAQWQRAELLPAYSGGTVMASHHLPHCCRLILLYDLPCSPHPCPYQRCGTTGHIIGPAT